MARCSMSAAAPAAALLSCGAACPTEASLRWMSRPRTWPSLKGGTAAETSASSWPMALACRSRQARLPARSPSWRSTSCPTPARAVLDMRRVTRSGGVLAAAVWDFCGDLVSPRLFWDTAAAIDPRAGVARDRLFSHPLAQPEGLASLWRASGLRDIEDRPLAATAWAVRGRVPVGPRGAPTYQSGRPRQANRRSPVHLGANAAASMISSSPPLEIVACC
jgi:hypothetical protein